MLPGAFGTLSEELQAQLFAAGRHTHWKRGTLLFYPDDPAEVVHLVLSGTVRLYRMSHNAREITLDVRTQGALLGTVSLAQYGEQPTYGLYAEAMEDVETLQFGSAALQQLLTAQPALAVILTQALTAQTRSVQQRLTGLVFLEISQRLALALLDLAGAEWSGAAPLALKERISHQDLAYIVGSTRETVTKLLGEFRERGLLDLGYRRILLTNRAGLEAAVRQPLDEL